MIVLGMVLGLTVLLALYRRLRSRNLRKSGYRYDHPLANFDLRDRGCVGWQRFSGLAAEHVRFASGAKGATCTIMGV